MELASRIRWILVIVVFVIIVGLLGWGLWSIAARVFRPTTSQDTSLNETAHNVLSTSQAKLIVDGRIVNKEDHRYYEIAVTNSTVTMKVYKGYGAETIAVKSYLNSDEAYDAFLNALDKLDVNARRDNTDTEDDYAEQGVCPNGKRYIVELDNEVRRWNSSCDSRGGTAGFNMTAVRRLFEDQVPDYRELIRGTGL